MIEEHVVIDVQKSEHLVVQKQDMLIVKRSILQTRESIEQIRRSTRGRGLVVGNGCAAESTACVATGLGRGKIGKKKS